METIKSKYLGKISDDFQLLAEIVLKGISLARRMPDGADCRALHEEIAGNELLIDSLDVKMREEVISAIFLFNPKATDLRKIIAYHDMTIYLERVGDQILNISHSFLKCSLQSPPFAPFHRKIARMLRYAEEMVRNAVFAFTCEDNSMAYLTIETDDRVDALFHEITALLHTSFQEKVLSSQDLLNITCINSISYNIERIGDNATNIAEAAIYLMEGKDIRHGNKQ
jgi:phosphate transport system protein